MCMEIIQTELSFTDKKPIFHRLGNLAEIANIPTAVMLLPISAKQRDTSFH